MDGPHLAPDAHGDAMIATIVLHEGRPFIPLPSAALDGLRPGQRVRVTMQPLTPVVESDGTPL